MDACASAGIAHQAYLTACLTNLSVKSAVTDSLVRSCGPNERSVYRCSSNPEP